MRSAGVGDLCTGRCTWGLTVRLSLPDYRYPDLFTSGKLMTAHRRAMLLLLVLSGLIISLCMGLRQSLGLFMRPMTLEFGISAASFGFSIALQNIVWGISQPFVGAAADRYGPRPVLVATALIYAL